MSSNWDGQRYQGAAHGAQSVSVREPLRTVDEVARDFGWALTVLRLGHRVCRRGWNGKGMWLEIQHPDTSSRMTLPYVFMKTVDGNLVPWLASQTDLLAADWCLASE